MSDADKILTIVAEWYADVNNGLGWGPDDLINDLVSAGFDLPDTEDEE